MTRVATIRGILLGCLVAGLAGCVSQQATAPTPEPVLAEKVVGPRLRIAVVEFENKTVYGSRLGTAASDILVTELAKTGRFILIERQKLEKVMAEQKLGITGAVDPDTAAKMGKVLGAAAIVSGAVSQFGVKTEGSDALIMESKRQVAEAVVDIRIIDAETAQILYAESGKGTAITSTGSFLGLGSRSSYDEALEGKALRAAITGFVNNVVKRLVEIPWSCRVAEVDGQTIYLDAGQASGLDAGSILEVIQLGAEIKSPATGLVIGRKETRLGRLKVVQHMGEDASTAQMIEGNAPARGDLCRMMRGVNPGY
jgi:curli biogenesis system outer membrane secretion channel CsgG